MDLSKVLAYYIQGPGFWPLHQKKKGTDHFIHFIKDCSTLEKTPVSTSLC
jgi:hypothetical protein